MVTELSAHMKQLGVSSAEVHRRLVKAGFCWNASTVYRWLAGKTSPSVGEAHALFEAIGLPVEERLRAIQAAGDHLRTTTAATDGTDSRNGPTVLEGLASTSIGVSSAAQDVSGRAEERVSNMVASGDPLNVAPPHRHTQPSERDEPAQVTA